MRKMTICGVIAVMIAALVVGPSLLLSTSAPVVEANAGTQWNAKYYNNISLSGDPVLSRVDDKIDFNWGTGSPDSKVNADNFSARWKKTVNFPTAGKWTFRVGADDGVRMWIDITPIVDEWHGNSEGYRTYEVSIDTLTAGDHDLKVEYYESTGNAGVKVEWFYGSGDGTGGSIANWKGKYFNSQDLSGTAALTRTDPVIDFNWGTGSPDSKIDPNSFSVRWTATVDFPYPGHWRFVVGADDGIRMWIDVTQLFDEWHGNPEGYRSYSIDLYALTAGDHDLKVEYFEDTGNAGVQVKWEYIGVEGTGGDAASLTLTPAPTATPIPPATVYAAATASNINVRTGPGLGNPIITKLVYEKNYLVLGAVPDLSWLLIDLGNGTSGWVSNDWVWLYAKEPEENEDTTGGGQPDFVDDIPRIDIPIAPPASLSEDDPLRVILTGRTTDTVNMRDGPSLYTGKIIGSVPASSTLSVEAHNGNGAWYLVSYQGIRGWVSALYVDLLDGGVSQLVVSSEVVPSPPSGAIFVPEVEPGVYVTVRGRATSNLVLRDAASLRGNDIGSVPQNAEFVIEGRNSTGAWYLITWEDVQGWIYSPYVTLIEGGVPDLPIR